MDETGSDRDVNNGTASENNRGNDHTEASSIWRTPRRWRARTVMIVGAVGALVLGSAATGIVGASEPSVGIPYAQINTDGPARAAGHSPSLVPNGSIPNGSSSAFSNNVQGGFSRANNPVSASAASSAQAVGVVLINTMLKYQGAEAAGTGIILSAGGEILTNNHVVDGATTITVTIASTGVSYAADVVGTDPTDDIAVLALQGASGLKPATIARTADAAVTDLVTAVGNAGGTGTLSAASGTITALKQSITASGDNPGHSETLSGLIETDADVIAGDSGGPLYNRAGEVIGIDTAASSGAAPVTGYAIPIATAVRIATQMESGIESATITIGLPAFLGVEVTAGSDPSASGASALGSGAAVSGVLAGTPAAAAGIMGGDTITAVNGAAIASSSNLTTILQRYRPEDSVTIDWVDAAGTSHSARVLLVAGAAS